MSGHVLTRPVARRARRRSSGWLVRLAEALRVIRTRHHLAEMDARMLKDIGISRSEAMEEANRRPWDIGPRSC